MDVKMEDMAMVKTEEDSSTLNPSAVMAVEKIEKSAFDVLKETKKSVEDIVAHMLSIKKDDKPKSDIRELITQMFLHFVTLRQANRTILVEEDLVKSETERAKAPVDSATLQLHNLMYEKSHYLKAIKACKDFKSKYPDIQLVSEEEFFSKAPDEFKGAAMSNDSAHNVMLKRLNYELLQRKELCNLREKMEQRKKSLLETINNRKKFLSSLPSHLKSLKKASLPAQNQLGVLHTKRLKQLHAAELLPPPLYIIYSQFLAQKEAFDENVELEIIGSFKDAQVFARQQTNKDTAISVNHDNSRIEEDPADEEDDGQRRRKRPKKVPSKENHEATGLYQAHPLKVILHIHDDEVSDTKPSRLVTLKFEYLFKLNVVCVGIDGVDEGPENSILCNLFPDDNGIELPHQSAKVCLGNEAVFDERRNIRPYKWAQHLAGIDFLPEVSPLLTITEAAKTDNAKDVVVSGLSLYRQQNRVQTVVQRVRSRKKAQLALAEQLDLLTSLKWPPLSYTNVPWGVHNHQCCLHSWSRVESSTDENPSVPRADTGQARDSLDADVAERGGVSREELGIVTEDGELPSLVPAAVVIGNEKPSSNPDQGSDSEYPKRTTVVSKSVTPPKTVRALSFGRFDDDSELMLDSESEVDDMSKDERETKFVTVSVNSWVDYGAKYYRLVLTRESDAENRNIRLEAKVCISMEYPVRPPLFAVNIISPSLSKDSSPSDPSNWYNEVRAIEAEVNLHIVKMIPPSQENLILSHQVQCLGMLFDLYLDEAFNPSEKRKSTSVIDVGLSNPVSGDLVARSFRGRDRRKMISWKDIECTHGYPF